MFENPVKFIEPIKILAEEYGIFDTVVSLVFGLATLVIPIIYLCYKEGLFDR